MTGVLLLIPENPDAVPSWLESHLLSSELGQLVAELGVLHPTPDATPPLELVLGGYTAEVLERGLGALPRPALGLLLRIPSLLPVLRDLILTDGGRYWDCYLKAEKAAAKRVTAHVLQSIDQSAPSGRFGRWVSYGATIFATAAAVLVAVYLGGGFRRPDVVQPSSQTAAISTWGFQKIDQLPRDSTDAATLTALANLVDEFDKKATDTPHELLRRLVEFREGCGAIRLATNLPLSEPQVQWLKLRCGDWTEEIDHCIRTLEETRDAVSIRASALRTASNISGELRSRALSAR